MNATEHLEMVKMVLLYFATMKKKHKKEKATRLIDLVHESFLRVALAQLRARARRYFVLWLFGKLPEADWHR